MARGKKNWIQKAVPRGDKDRGSFSKKAQRAGMTTAKYAQAIVNKYKGMKNLSKDKLKLYRQALFAKNTIKLSKK